MTASLEDSFDTDPWEPAHPGWDVDELLELDPDDLGAGESLAALRAVSQAESMLRAKRLEVMAAYQLAKVGDPDAEWVADTIAAEVTISIPRAHGELALAQTLSTRLPQTFHWLALGKLDIWRARQIADATISLTDEQHAELEARIYPEALKKTPRQLSDLLRRTVIDLAPDAAAHRAEAAKQERRVSIEPASDGMGWLNAFLRAEDLCAIYQRVDDFARHAKSADDHRTMNQVRADVFRDLLLGTATWTSGGVTTHVYVTTTATTLLGLDELPGDLRGYGPLPANRIREIAFDLKATWTGVLVDDDGYPTKLAAQRYRFPARLAEFIRLRDQTCCRPGCNKPADKCDVDHLIPYPRGETTAENGNAECRRHHREKHQSGWTVHRDTAGNVLWISPTGHTQTNHRQRIAPASDDSPPF